MTLVDLTLSFLSWWTVDTSECLVIYLFPLYVLVHNCFAVVIKRTETIVRVKENKRDICN